ncbi:TetR/AcrR family transcriptional regulator [Curtobacterium sp. SL109]|uniref:TetR/AcrR family transcriptional regulator n=1 Tax=Curtobacterium sp. SL109 TaxID=2994662 RepID=UPI002275A72A|nr:TetR family transcriptional regulator [Curtobacterium sp. SL109]MCY1695080.1 TetR family transcriptional regulator [Curtobacterium sp. SL109]
MRAPRQTGAARTSGADTRQRAQDVALRLFTQRGYEGTSLRDIADELGINKASLYYYFDGKEGILQSLFEQRGDEAEDLLTWVQQQPSEPALLEVAVQRWVGSFTVEKLQGIRFLVANPLVLRSLPAGAARIGNDLNAVADALAALLPDPSDENVLLLRMGLLAINAAVQAAVKTDLDDAAIVAAAGRSATALVRIASEAPVHPPAAGDRHHR